MLRGGSRGEFLPRGCTHSDYMPLYSLHRGGMSFAGVGWMQVGGDKKNSFMSRGIITDFFQGGSKSGRIRDDPWPWAQFVVVCREDRVQRDSYWIAHANERIARLRHQFFIKLENPMRTKIEWRKLFPSNAMDGDIHYIHVVNYGQDAYELLKRRRDVIRI